MKTSLTSPRSTEFSPTASGVRCAPDCTATVQHCKEISNAGHIAVSRFVFNPSRKDGRRKETRNKGDGLEVGERAVVAISNVHLWFGASAIIIFVCVCSVSLAVRWGC